LSSNTKGTTLNMSAGIVKWFSPEKGYGYITRMMEEKNICTFFPNKCEWFNGTQKWTAGDV